MQFTDCFPGVTAVLYLHESIHIYCCNDAKTSSKTSIEAVIRKNSKGIPPNVSIYN